jgi:hypothetical protein
MMKPRYVVEAAEEFAVFWIFLPAPLLQVLEVWFPSACADADGTNRFTPNNLGQTLFTKLFLCIANACAGLAWDLETATRG